jgi:hypothetical protein
MLSIKSVVFLLLSRYMYHSFLTIFNEDIHFLFSVHVNAVSTKILTWQCNSFIENIWEPCSLLSCGSGGSFLRGKRNWCTKLTSHLHLLLRLRMNGAVPPLLIHLHAVVLIKHSMQAWERGEVFTWSWLGGPKARDH